MFETGDEIPDFSLSAADEPYAAYMLSAAAQEGPVVLAVVPDGTDDTRSFLESVTAINWDDIIDNISLYAIGPERESLAELAASEEFSFPILADRAGDVLDGFGLGAGETRRALVLVDPLSTVQFVWRAADTDETPPLAELQAAVESISARDGAVDELPPGEDGPDLD